MIKSFLKRYGLLIVFFIVFSVVAISSFNYVQTQEKKLPIYSPSMVSDELVEEDLRYVKKYHRISDFSLLNQNGNNVTQEDYKNKIYVADFFFTTCPDICPIMTGNMLYLQENLKDTNVMLASFSVTPKIDTVEVLKEYSTLKGVDDSRWNLMTGDKKQIYDLARKSYLVAKAIPDGKNHGMIHTENFVLVDRDKRIRGYYDGTNIEDMDKLLDDIQILIKSYENS
jgi:protein SCO1/2|tara:strand:- start:181 stop:858 length:678 start_codon:yes stop_codon:yes gene_type:complete